MPTTSRPRPTTRRPPLRLLELVPLFSGLSRAQLSRVADLAQEVSYGSGRMIVRTGTPGLAFYVIVVGRAKVIRGKISSAKGQALGPGDFFGEMALLAPGPRMATVKAESDVEAIKIGAERFQAFLVEHPAVSLSMMKQLVVRLREVEQRIDAWMA
jgi:CRP-like cAMP-binding protein